MSHHSTNSFEFVNMTGHISPVGVSDGFDEGFKGLFTLFRKSFVSFNQVSSCFSSVRGSCFRNVSSCCTLAAQCQQLVVNLFVYFCVEACCSWTVFVVEGCKSAFNFKVSPQLQVEIVPLCVQAVRLSGLCDVARLQVLIVVFQNLCE